MSPHQRARTRTVTRLSEVTATVAHVTADADLPAEINAEVRAGRHPAAPSHRCGHFEHFPIRLSATQASHLRALADHERTIAAELLERWVSERLDQQDMPRDALPPSNVVRLPYVH